MAKNADYYVAAVRLNEQGTHIVKLKAFVCKDDNNFEPDQPIAFERSEVVAKIRDGKKFVTIYKGQDEKWKLGNEISVVEFPYLRTDRNNTDADNLDNLPRF